MRILLVEDDNYTLAILHEILTGQNFLVDEATDGEMAWALLQQFVYDLMLLDVMLPKLDGMSLCRRVRQMGNPVLVMLLTTCTNINDKLLGLESGADDYLTKPFHTEELTARIRTLTRRNATAVNLVLTYERLSLNPISRQVTYDGHPLPVGRKEYLLLELLLRHPHQVFSRDEIIDRLWSLDQEIPTDATVKSHIRSIRRKLELVGASDLIETLYGQGYRLNPALEQQSAMEPLSDPKLEAVNHLTAQVWQRAYVKSLDKIHELEQAIDQCQAGNLSESTRQQAIFTAHKLAGSLYVFGFEVAAQLLQQIEDTFRQGPVASSKAAQLLQWAQMARLELAGQQSSIAQIQTASPALSAATKRNATAKVPSLSQTQRAD